VNKEPNFKEPNFYDGIVGEKLSAITFVLDYWQLQFDGPAINALTRLQVSANNGIVLSDGDDQFRNLICGQIGKVVAESHSRNGKSLKSYLRTAPRSLSLLKSRITWVLKRSYFTIRIRLWSLEPTIFLSLIKDQAN
jgi:hypothetical protein